MKSAGLRLQKVFQEDDQNVTDETVLDIAVSFDGTSLKEGTRRCLVSCLLFPLILGKCCQSSVKAVQFGKQKKVMTHLSMLNGKLAIHQTVL